MAHLTDVELSSKIQELQEQLSKLPVKVRTEWIRNELSTILAGFLELQERRRKDSK